jgi:ketosteroid isomerase-like protein
MTRDEVALVRALVDAVNRGDWESAVGHIAPDFEYDLTRTDSPMRGIYEARQMRRVFEEFIGSWESVRYEPREFIAGEGCVIVPFTTHFRGRDGIEIQTEAVWVWRYSDGEIVRLTLFQDRDEALADARAG